MEIITKVDPLQLVQARWMTAQGAMSSQISKWEVLLKQYRLGSFWNLQSTVDERQRQIQNDVTIARTSSSVMWNAVETVGARLMANFSNEGWFTVLPRPLSNTTNKSAKYVEDKLKFQFDLSNINPILRTGAKQTAKIGNSIFKIEWDTEEGKIYTLNPIGQGQNGGVTYEKVESTGVIKAAPSVSLIPFRDFYPDPKALSLETCQYVIQEGVLSLDECERRANMGIFDEDAVRQLKEAYYKGEYGRDPTTFNDKSYGDLDIFRQDVRVIGYYEPKRWVFVASPWAGAGGSGVILNPTNQDNPYDHNRLPFVHWRLTPDEDYFWSQGILEPVRDLQAIMTTFQNMAIDAANKTLRPPKLIEKGVDIDIRKLEHLMPDQLVEYEFAASDRNRSMRDRIYEFKPDPNSFVMQLPTMMAMLDREAQRITKNASVLSGESGVGSNKTARGVMQLTGNANMSIQADIDTLASGAVAVLEMMHDLNKQYGDAQEDQYGIYQFKVFQDAYGDLNTKILTLQQNLPVISQLGGDVLEVVKRILRYAGEVGLDSIFPRDGTMDMNQQRQKMGELVQMMYGANQQGGQGGQGNQGQI